MHKAKVESFLQRKITATQVLGGGCISVAEKITTDDGQHYFLKSGVSPRQLIAEANGLLEIAKSNTIAVPDVLCVDDDFLLLSFVKSAPRSSEFFSTLAQQLAAMHRCCGDGFGFFEDNYIGSTPQLNVPSAQEKSDWISLYFNKRLKFQFDLAVANGYVDAQFRHQFSLLENRFPLILNGADATPSLLHGDLWGGNFMVGDKGHPVLIDPAVYYGHHEADLAMTRIFGGFPLEFYEAYDSAFPLQDGWEYRENIYKLYHIMNHLNLFGSSYYAETLSLIQYYVK